MKFPSKTIAVGTACAVLGGGGIATAATGMIDGHTIKPGSIPANRLNHDAQKAITRALHYTTGTNGDTGATGPAGATGAAGPQGKQGFPGLPGPSGLDGAFYSVEQYPNGAGSGAVATAACDPTNATNSQRYVAISGGVQDTDNSTDMSTLNSALPVAASFPGRMNWSNNTPLPNRLDGWIIQFASGNGQDKPMSVWALCAPAHLMPTVTNSAS